MNKIPIITASKDKSSIEYIVHFNIETSRDDAKNYADMTNSTFVKKYRSEDNSFVYKTDRLNINNAEKKLFKYSKVQGISIIQSLDQKRYAGLGGVINSLNNLMITKAPEDEYKIMLDSIIGNLEKVKDDDGLEYHPNFRYRKAAKKKK